MIQLAETPGADGEYLTEQQRWTNLGPIVDFVVVDLERQAAVTEPLRLSRYEAVVVPPLYR